eukprot:GHRR01020340.1.p2 GENE.GHRR01020340.1~~GHRR01020340.1.p2  ORF type:complete len:155 (-),score=17.75 GHRR01020340.1:20-484(-)
MLALAEECSLYNALNCQVMAALLVGQVADWSVHRLPLLACRNVALRGVTHDIHSDVKQDESVVQMHADAERFDPRTEEAFKMLQVISACAMSFAHGANDVANAVGSFAAASYVYQNGAVSNFRLFMVHHAANVKTILQCFAHSFQSAVRGKQLS